MWAMRDARTQITSGAVGDRTDQRFVDRRPRMAVALTSEHNRRLYGRHGFEVVGELSADGSPSLWPMWREPRVAG
jgi:hypothetical protein